LEKLVKLNPERADYKALLAQVNQQVKGRWKADCQAYKTLLK
jgi:hypothetical protein